MDKLDAVRSEVLMAVHNAPDADALEAVRIAALGKKGRITALMKGLGHMDADARRTLGVALNALKDDVAQALDHRKKAFEAASLQARLDGERVDVSLPIRPQSKGALHPLSQTLDEVVAIFAQMGFELAEGPDIEDDFHNFTALNFPPAHPARDMHDTFFLPRREDGTRHVLRTHTSPVQIRTMRSRTPPLRVICPGRTYRCDSDMTHTPMFHQVEGLVVDSETTMAHLKGCMKEFVETYFEVDTVPVRFRPSFFPFTEPSAEVDIGCSRKDGDLKIGDGDSWLEILGCGMVHPNVLKACGYDPNDVQGFAFGMGLERIAMLKYGIPDMRTFFESDVRWLRHYGFGCLDIPTLGGGLSR